MTPWLHALPVPLLVYALIHVPGFAARDRAVLAQRWAPRLVKGASRWTRAAYVGGRAWAWIVEVAVLAAGCHYGWLALRAAGWIGGVER